MDHDGSLECVTVAAFLAIIDFQGPYEFHTITSLTDDQLLT